MSKLEEALAQQLDLMGRDARWPFAAPVRQYRPWWCCQHTLAKHGPVRGRWRLCRECAWLCEQVGERTAHSVDFAWPAARVAVECEGVTYGVQGGRHQRGKGFEADAQKYARLELDGWRVVRVTQRLITSGVALSLIEQALRSRRKNWTTCSGC